MKPGGTQSGRLDGVKKKHSVDQSFAALVLGLLYAGLLTACAAPTGGWHQPSRNEALTQSDYAACQARAEQATLERRRTNRQGYGLMNDSATGVFNPRGDDTMAIAERSDTSTLYNTLVARCMTQKGYQREGDS